MPTSRTSGRSTPRNAISSVSRADLNPYLDLLYRSLADVGIPIGPPASLEIAWLWRHRNEVRYIHVHWPEALYRFQRGPTRLRPYLSWLKFVLFAVRLRVARVLGYRLIWTIHQVYPHDGEGRLDRTAARTLARSADLLLAHDPETAAHAQMELGRTAEVIPHGSYVGVYPRGRSRTEVRSALGVPEDAVVFLCFGELRSNSDVTVLLEAFMTARNDPIELIIAGNAKDQGAGVAVSAAAEADDRIVRIEGFVPAERVRELYEAADVVVTPRGDGGTSGSLILALSLGTPVIAADMPAYRRLLDDGAAGWLFRPGDAEDLCATLKAAALDEQARVERAAVARLIAGSLDWRESAMCIKSLLPD